MWSFPKKAVLKNKQDCPKIVINVEKAPMTCADKNVISGELETRVTITNAGDQGCFAMRVVKKVHKTGTVWEIAFGRTNHGFVLKKICGTGVCKFCLCGQSWDTYMSREIVLCHA